MPACAAAGPRAVTTRSEPGAERGLVCSVRTDVVDSGSEAAAAVVTISGQTSSFIRGSVVADLASPPAVRLARPRWLDLRMAGGVALLLASVVGVAAVVAGADHTTPVWVASRPLAAGVLVSADDVRVDHVHLGSPATASTYLPAAVPIVGSVVVRPVGADELIPAGAVAKSGTAPARRLVTVAVQRFHFPTDLAAGDVVDVYLVPGAGSSALPSDVGAPRLVLSAVVVSSVDDSGSRFGGSTDVGVGLAVPPDDVTGLVGAAARGSLTLVAVPAGVSVTAVTEPTPSTTARP